MEFDLDEENAQYVLVDSKSNKRKASKAVKKSVVTKKSAIKEKNKKTSVPVIEDWEKFMDRDPTLNEVQEMIEQLNSTNSSKQKQIVLSKFPHCVKALYYVNHPFWQFNVSSDNVEKNKTKLANYKQIGNINEESRFPKVRLPA